MADESEKSAKETKARRLRARIRRLISGEETPGPEPADESPRDFIHRRMGERDRD